MLESVLEGQTIGKRIMQVKVVKIDGFQASFSDYIIRWIFRIIDLQIFSAIIGLIVILFNSKSQRLGDMAAGTSVINLKNNINISHTILENIDENYVPTYAAVVKLTDNDARIIKETFKKARENGNYETIAKLKDKIEQVTGVKNISGIDADFIQVVLKDYNFYTGK